MTPQTLLALILASALLAVSVSADIDIEAVTCTDDGRAVIDIAVSDIVGRTHTDDIDLEIRQTGGEYFEPNGEWDRGYVYNDHVDRVNHLLFSTPSMYLNEPIEYRARATWQGQTTLKSFSCPGFRFSCKMFDLIVDSCNTFNGTFTAFFVAHGFKETLEFPSTDEYDIIDDMVYEVKAKKRFCDNEGLCSAIAGLPKDSVIEYQGNGLYKLTWETNDNEVEAFGIEVRNSSFCQENPDYRETRYFDNKLCTADPYYEEPYRCDGCETREGICIPAESSVKQNGVMKYCSPYGKLLAQKNNGVSCKFDFECQSQYCKEGVCTEVPQVLPTCPANQALLNDCRCGKEIFSYASGGATEYCCGDVLSLQACGSGTVPETGSDNGEVPEEQGEEMEQEQQQTTSGWTKFWTWLRGIFS